jgi:glycosyltransferase involved in cell wall biosynthesis
MTLQTQVEELIAQNSTLSIIIPAYNEENRIGHTLVNLLDFLNNEYFQRYAIIIVMDGCDDSTPDVVNEFKVKGNPIVSILFSQRLGKGGAIIRGLEFIKSEAILVLDADFPIETKSIMKMLDKLDSADLVIGSRYNNNLKNEIPLNRYILSRLFNCFVKLMFPQMKHYSDTQCGVKVFKRKVAEKIKPDLMLTDFAFDVNFIYSAINNGFLVDEVGIPYNHNQCDSKVSNHILKICLSMFFSIIRLRMQYSKARSLLSNNLIKSLSSFLFRVIQ